MTSPPPPPLTWWGHLWRYLVAALVSGLAWFELADYQWERVRWWFWLDLGVGIVGFVLVAWRRRLPVGVALLTNALCAISGSMGGPATLALFSLATRRRWRELALVGVVAFLAGIVLVGSAPRAQEDTPVVTLALLVGVIGVTIGWGMYIGSRRELVATLRDRALTAENEQAARVTQARSAERSRIAREMHDVLAHRISLVAMHAGALAYREDLPAAQVRSTAELIQETSHQALVELREVLGVLREDPGDAQPEPPQPDATDIPDLVVEARRSGMRVQTEEVFGHDLADVPVSVGRAAYRIVQEGLTNARKHAPDTLVTVDLGGAPGEGLVVRVSNPLGIGASLGAPASGLGLVGLRERAELAGGRLDHEVTPRREFVLRAWLPWAP